LYYLIRKKEESVAIGLQNGPSKVSTELILMERCYGGKEPILGVEDVIAKVVIGKSMELPRAGASDGVDDAAS
jgi:hypothetical protein